MPVYSLGDRHPTLPEGFHWIAETATIVGTVELAEDSSVWFGAAIRGDNTLIRIGRGTNIQENAVLHSDAGFPLTIGAYCTIGHKAMVHGCTIGDNCMIGMSATVLNGAKIGNNCLIGAGALVTERTEIPDNSLVIGAPGKVARMLDEERQAWLRRMAENYVTNARRFASELKRIG